MDREKAAHATANALRTPMDREQAAHTTAKRARAFTLPKQRGPERVRGFTLAELLVTMGVLVLLVFLASQLLNTAATVTRLGHKQMDADAQTRQLLDRMEVDVAQMVKRADVDYYVKSSWFATGSPSPAPGTASGDRTPATAEAPATPPTI